MLSLLDITHNEMYPDNDTVNCPGRVVVNRRARRPATGLGQSVAGTGLWRYLAAAWSWALIARG